MSKWKLHLQNIGRNKISETIKITALTLPDAEDKALQKCSKYLMSNDIFLEESTNLTYAVFAGFHKVGQVLIESA